MIYLSPLADEIQEQLQGVVPEAIVLSVGGGGLLCGVQQGLSRVGWTNVEILAVETEGRGHYSLYTVCQSVCPSDCLFPGRDVYRGGQFRSCEGRRKSCFAAEDQHHRIHIGCASSDPCHPDLPHRHLLRCGDRQRRGLGSGRIGGCRSLLYIVLLLSYWLS